MVLGRRGAIETKDGEIVLSVHCKSSGVLRNQEYIQGWRKLAELQVSQKWLYHSIIILEFLIKLINWYVSIKVIHLFNVKTPFAKYN